MGDWIVEKLGQLASIEIGGTPARERSEYWAGPEDEGFPWVSISDLGSRVVHDTKERITAVGVRNSNVKRVAAGTLLMSFKLTIGRSSFAGHDLYTNEAIAALVPRDGILEPSYLSYVLPGVARRAITDTAVKGATLNKKTLRELVVSFPAQVGEQQRIAEILSTVDEAIEQTEALIAKTQQIKAGLMHDLFTRGVTADGQLRPPREEAPQVYKESPLGWIPKDWETRTCADVTDMITVGVVVRPTQYYIENGVPAFRSANIREDGIDPSDLIYISPESNALLSKSQVRCGDVLSVRTGYPGTSAVVPDEYSGANCVDILISRPAKGLNSDYLATWINSPFGKEQVLRKQGGLAQQHFNVGELRELVVVLPTLEEQERIITRLQAVSSRVKLETSMARRYQDIKKGLMQDLLTGRVSVVADVIAPSKDASVNV